MYRACILLERTRFAVVHLTSFVSGIKDSAVDPTQLDLVAHSWIIIRNHEWLIPPEILVLHIPIILDI